MNQFKHELMIMALLFSGIPLAEAQTCFGESCGIVFTETPAVPSLTIANCNNPVETVYTLQNQGSTNTLINLDLDENDSLNDPTAVSIDTVSSTCSDGGTINAGDSCTVTLSFQPCAAGDLNWNFGVVPDSTQRPLILALETTVGIPPYAYVINSEEASISACPVNEDGSFGTSAGSPCSDVSFDFGDDSSPFTGFWDMVINADGTLAYISSLQAGSDSLAICPIIDSLTFGSDETPCSIVEGLDSDSVSTFFSPGGLTINTTSQVLYVANTQAPTVSMCPLNEDGSLQNCTYVETSYYYPRDIALNDDNSLAYVTVHTDPGIVVIFDIDPTSGNLTFNNEDDDFSFVYSSGIMVQEPYVYVTNYSVNTLSSCLIDGPDLAACSTISGFGEFTSPAGVSANDSGFYIANTALNDGNYIVAFCASDLSSCSGLTDSLFKQPGSVVFFTFDGPIK